MLKPKVALGLSGGVDSAVSAKLLLEQGYDVTAVYLECWRAPGCRSEKDRADAVKIALELNIPFQSLDFIKAYKDKVVEYFFAEYEAGRTPNPDVLCNREIKFGLFYDWALEQGFEYVATGHYARIVEWGERGEGKKQKALAVPKDEHKDQTYFLYQLRPAQLDHILFPLADKTKTEVRQLATDYDLPVASKPDSVGICFIGDIDVRKFLKDRLGENPGEVVDIDGNVIGKHNGLWFYTIGQRHGFEIYKHTFVTKSDGTVVDKHNFPPFYVIEKKALSNQLVVGFGYQTTKSRFTIESLHWLIDQTQLNLANVLVRIRHTGQLLPTQLAITRRSGLVTLAKPTQGIAPGQSAVIYQQENHHTILVGGGVISET